MNNITPHKLKLSSTKSLSVICHELFQKAVSGKQGAKAVNGKCRGTAERGTTSSHLEFVSTTKRSICQERVQQSLHGTSHKVTLETPKDGVELWLGYVVFSGMSHML